MSYKSVCVVILSIFLVACYETSKSSSATLNKTHPFIISGCEILYRGKNLELGEDISKWAEVLGPYDRRVELANDVYVWDQIGLNVLSLPGRKRAEEMAIIFNIERGVADEGLHLPGKEKLMLSLKRTLEARPTSLYTDAFLLDSVPFGQKFDLGDANAGRFSLNEKQPFFHKTYADFRFQFERNCGEKELAYIVHTFTNDTSRVTNFAVGFTN